MKRGLLLMLVLVLGLLIFNGCEMANNPMEVEDTYNGSTELSKSSETSLNISMELVNINSNGTWVVRFYHEGLEFKLVQFFINNVETPIISQLNHSQFDITQVIISVMNIELNEDGIDQIKYIAEIEGIDGIVNTVEIEGVESGHFTSVDDVKPKK